MQTKVKFTPEQKLGWWGQGEWVNEPDEITFTHNGIDCLILRMAIEEPYAKDFHMFGGYFNAYVMIPTNHPFYKKDYNDIDIDCHCGLTYGDVDKDTGQHWIGFDCAHSCDYTPSTEHMKKTADWMREVREKEEELKIKFNIYDSHIFQRTYRNIQFCIEQCKSMADQLEGIYDNI